MKEKSMKPYILIEGSNQAIDTFEQKVASALDMGYVIAGDLSIIPHAGEYKLYQPMILEIEEEQDDDWEDDTEDEDDDE
jgi:hypothetical protein